jgi:hypothetical protein
MIQQKVTKKVPYIRLKREVRVIKTTGNPKNVSRSAVSMLGCLDSINGLVAGPADTSTSNPLYISL